MQEIKEKVVIITGGTKGIGYGMAEALINKHVNVAITGRTEEVVKEAAAKLNAIGKGRALGLVSDVRNLDSEQKAVDQVLAEWGSLDVLIANAGVGHFNSIEDLTAEQWNEIVDVNLTGVFHSVKASLASLKKSQGYIITIASLAGTNFFAGGSAYNASKFGLVGFTQAIMLDLRKHGIKVSTIMPGSVATNFNGHQPNPNDDWKIQPEDLGKLVVDMLEMNPRTLPSKIEVRPSLPPGK